MSKLEPREMKNGRWEVCLWDHRQYRWTRCKDTATFSSRANAMAGMYRYRDKTEGRDLLIARHKLMKSNPFCVGVFK